MRDDDYKTISWPSDEGEAMAYLSESDVRARVEFIKGQRAKYRLHALYASRVLEVTRDFVESLKTSSEVAASIRDRARMIASLWETDKEPI